MKIPNDPVERNTLYKELVRACDCSRKERFEFYQRLRNFALFGTEDTSGADYNKIGSTLETLGSFIYTPASTRFSIHLGSAAPKDDLAKVPALVHEINDQWRMGRSHLIFGLALRWSLVFGTTLVKGVWKKGLFRSYLVEPHQFGVLREDVPLLDEQEAFVHHYTITKSNLAIELRDNPRRDAILAGVNRGTNDGDNRLEAGGMSRLILGSGVSLTSPSSGAGSSVDGGLAGDGGFTYDYAPKVEAELLDMVELWVWNDDENDYQVVTMCSPDVVIYDRKNFTVPGVSPFVKVTAGNNLYDYFWEMSFVAGLTKLQAWRVDRMMQIREILAKQANPAMALSGFQGLSDEKMQALRSAGGLISAAMPGAKVEQFAPTMPPNIFTDLDMIDKMFDDMAGIGHILQGKGEAGVRSKGQADLLARLGSSRPKERALIAEEAAEDLATLLLRNVQAHSKQRFRIDAKASGGGFWKGLFRGGQENNQGDTPLLFVASQFTNDYEVRVDAHSSSPIFVEDRKSDAYQMHEAGLIDGESALEMVAAPGEVQLLLEKYPQLEVKRAAAAAAQGGAK